MEQTPGVHTTLNAWMLSLNKAQRSASQGAQGTEASLAPVAVRNRCQDNLLKFNSLSVMKSKGPPST